MKNGSGYEKTSSESINPSGNSRAGTASSRDASKQPTGHSASKSPSRKEYIENLLSLSPEQLHRFLRISLNDEPIPPTFPPLPKIILDIPNRNTEAAREVVEYLNTRLGSRYRMSRATLRPILARLNEGFRKEDLMRVIDIKIADWSSSELSKYLRPQTLFGPKFEAYLNQPPSGIEAAKKWASDAPESTIT